jgi:L,D-transpeptidase ErfK/SrfK
MSNSNFMEKLHPRDSHTVQGWTGRLSSSLQAILKVGITGSTLAMVGVLPALAENNLVNPHPLKTGPIPSSQLLFTPPLGSAADYLPEVQIPENIYLLLKLSERTLYLYDHQNLVKSYPVAVGRTGWETPTGRFSIFEMQQNPAWQHPFTGEVVPPGGNNPLGQRWLGFWSDGTNSIGFHGTPQESSIGQAISHGCVRLRNQDVVELYEKVALGTPVYVVP